MIDMRIIKMKTLRSALVLGVATIALTLLLPFCSSGQAFAQEEDSRASDMRSNERMPAQGDGGLIARLNLTPDQVRRIREIRKQNAEEMRNTRQRMARAQNALDEAIYADSVDESAIEARARDLAAAQVAVVRLRALTELRIRRLLTPEQLNLLRGFRQEAKVRGERDRENQRGRRQNPTAFQERQNQNDFGPNPSGVIGPNPNGVKQPNNTTEVKPGTTEKTPSDTTPASGKP